MAEFAAIATVGVGRGGVAPAAWHGWTYRMLGTGADPYHRAGVPPFALQPAPDWNTAHVVLLDGTLAGTVPLRTGAEGPAGRQVEHVTWQFVPYGDLIRASHVGSRFEIGLEFRTPAAFRQGPLQMLVPLPRLVFGGLQRLWEVFVKLPLGVSSPEAYERDVEMTWVQLTTQEFDTGLGRFRGVTGRVRYRTSNADLAATMLTLARFGELAGVGRKRAYGMGVIPVQEM